MKMRIELLAFEKQNLVDSNSVQDFGRLGASTNKNEVTIYGKNSTSVSVSTLTDKQWS